MAYALDFVGDKWTLLVLRDLILGHKRYFQELLASHEGIATNILASRLKSLEAAGFVTRHTDPAQARRVIYAPTEKALDLLPVLIELMRWSAKHDPASGVSGECARRLTDDPAGFIAEVRASHRKAGSE